MSKELKELKWNELKLRIGKHGEEITSALRELYEVFGTEIVDWYASLYDPEHGMWYHAKSAQATDGYLPDIESMWDAVGFLTELGATEGTPWYELFPDWLKEKIGKFVYNLQDPDGYFYHPQWGKNIHNLRKSRDLGTCITCLRYLGIEPKYRLPTATDSTDGKRDLSATPTQFQSVESFKKYLADMDFVTNSYKCGSELSSSMGEVEAYGKMLGEDLVKITLDTLAAHQRKDNGLWHPEANRYGGNGAQKISKIFNWYNRMLPYTDEGIDSLMNIIISDEPPNAVVQVYNPWHALASLIRNKEICGAPEAELDALVDRLYEWAPAAIRKSTEHIKLFKQQDGALSYAPDYSCATKCGSPCAVPETREGDVNGTACASAMIASIYNALGLSDYAVPVYSSLDMKRFLKIVEEREQKYNAEGAK